MTAEERELEAKKAGLIMLITFEVMRMTQQVEKINKLTKEYDALLEEPQKTAAETQPS